VLAAAVIRSECDVESLISHARACEPKLFSPRCYAVLRSAALRTGNCQQGAAWWTGTRSPKPLPRSARRGRRATEATEATEAPTVGGLCRRIPSRLDLPCRPVHLPSSEPMRVRSPETFLRDFLREHEHRPHRRAEASAHLTPESPTWSLSFGAAEAAVHEAAALLGIDATSGLLPELSPEAQRDPALPDENFAPLDESPAGRRAQESFGNELLAAFKLTTRPVSRRPVSHRAHGSRRARRRSRRVARRATSRAGPKEPPAPSGDPPPVRGIFGKRPAVLASGAR
jgi:hypothetical protein